MDKPHEHPVSKPMWIRTLQEQPTSLSLSSSVSVEDLSSTSSNRSSRSIGTPSPVPSSESPTSYGLVNSQLLEQCIDQFHKNRSISDARSLKQPQRRSECCTTLVDEIQEKYNTEQGLCTDGGAAIFVKQFNSPLKGGCLPGKRGASGYLELMALNSRQIERVGDLGQLRALVCNITELDLAQNCLSDWKEVDTILNNMPLLRHCNLSHNPLYGAAPIQWNTTNGKMEMLYLEIFALNNTGVRWDTLFLLLPMLPRLSELHLSMNNYGERTTQPCAAMFPSVGFPSVSVLYLNNCGITDWRSLCRVCAPFPQVVNLVVADNPLRELGPAAHAMNVAVPPPTVQQQNSPQDQSTCMDTSEPGSNIQSTTPNVQSAASFASLHSLNVNRVAVQEWDEVQKLGDLPRLYDLKFGHVPLLMSLSEHERWQLLVARLPKVAVLNGSPISDAQREDAERFFLRWYYEAEHKPDRYHELERIHGVLEPLAQVNLRPNTHARVMVTCEEHEYNQHQSIALNQNVLQLKKQLASFVNVPPAKMRVFYQDCDGYMGLEELKLMGVMLHSIHMKDDDQIIVERKPEPVRMRTRSGRSSNSLSTSSNK